MNISQTHIHLLGIAGSLRQGSLNRALLLNACDLLPAGMSLEIYDLNAIPLYNADLEVAGLPDPVRDFKAHIAAADALLISTPEYNSSMPGVLKNALDWASRPVGQSPLSGKPAAGIGVSPGQFGAIRTLMQLRQVFVFTNMLPMSQPELFVTQAREKFDEQGNLVDAATRQRLAQFLESLRRWTIRLKAGAEALEEIDAPDDH